MTSSPEYEEKKHREAAEAPDASLRRRVESAAGRDPGAVRLHADAEGERVAEQAGARAVAHEHDVYFARQQYDPGSPRGQRLLAHELAHTLQRDGATGEATADREALEDEADRTAEAALRGERSPVRLRAEPGAALKEEKEKPAAAPSIQKHPDEIQPTPAAGTVAGGGFSIPYYYNVVKGGTVVPLTLQLPEGTAVVITPLTHVVEGTHYRAQNDSGTKARAVVVTIDANMRDVPKVQVAFTRGSATYLVVFQFPAGAKAGEK